MVIVALDQSTKISGYSVWDNNKIIAHGVLNSDLKENNYMKRIQKMDLLIEQLIDQYKPDYVGIEGVQFQSNYEVYHQLSCNQGSIMKLLFDRGISFEVVPVNTWRSHNGIKGNKKRAEQKLAAIALVKELYDIDATEDECEAILIGRYLIERK